MDNNVVTPLRNGYRLVAERSNDPNFSDEIYIGIVDADNVWYQNLAVVRRAYDISPDGVIEWKDDKFEVLVYSDKYDEDYTHKFVVGLCPDEESDSNE